MQKDHIKFHPLGILRHHCSLPMFTFLFEIVYLKSGGRFKFKFKFGFEIEFEFKLECFFWTFIFDIISQFPSWQIILLLDGAVSHVPDKYDWFWIQCHRKCRWFLDWHGGIQYAYEHQCISWICNHKFCRHEILPCSFSLLASQLK